MAVWVGEARPAARSLTTRPSRRRLAVTIAIGLAVAPAVMPPVASATDAKARKYAHAIIDSWDRSQDARETGTRGDGVVQRSEMRLRLSCGTGQGQTRDARGFFDHIDGHGGPRDRQGQYREAYRFMRSFDRNHNGLSDGEVSKAGSAYIARIKYADC